MSAMPCAVPSAPGSGVRIGPKKVDGLRISKPAMKVLERSVRSLAHRSVVLMLLNEVGFTLPSGCVLDAEATLERLGRSRNRLYAICALYPQILRIAFREDELHVFSEFGMWCARDRERDRGAAWDRTIASYRKHRRRYVFIDETVDALRRARGGGPKRGLAAQVPAGGFGPEYLFPVDNLWRDPVENGGGGSAVPTQTPELDFVGPPVSQSDSTLTNLEASFPTDSDLGSSSFSEPIKKSSDLGSSSFSGNTRDAEAHPPAGSAPGGEPGSAPERQEGQSEFHSPVPRHQRTGPPTLPGDGHVPAPRDTETSDQGATGSQASPEARWGLYVSPGRTDRISYQAFEESFVRHMRRTKPLWRFIRTTEAVAHMRTVWERWCNGKPLRWLDPWVDAQVDAFTQNVRSDGYQAQGFLRHMRRDAVYVPIPGPDDGPKKPCPPDSGAARETIEDVARIARESLFSHRTG